jgi:hypothetical protein
LKRLQTAKKHNIQYDIISDILLNTSDGQTFLVYFLGMRDLEIGLTDSRLGIALHAACLWVGEEMKHLPLSWGVPDREHYSVRYTHIFVMSNVFLAAWLDS